MGERTPPKTNGFWNSFRPITATPQKGPRRIAPAPIPAAASTCRGEMPYPTAVEQCTSAWYVGAAAIRGLHAIRCTTMFGNLSRAWYAAVVSAHPSRAESLETCGFKQRFWSLLGLRPKVTRARGRGTHPVGDMEEKRTGRRGRRPLQRVRRKCAGIWRCVDAGCRGRRPLRERERGRQQI